MPKAARRSPSKANTKYDYVELANASLTSNDTCNFYGVIVDATFPYQFINSSRGEKQFQVVLRVVDPSITKGSAQVVMYANKFEDLPIVQRLGDIIRVHRATARKNNKTGDRQFSANIYYSSSWALYSSDK